LINLEKGRIYYLSAETTADMEDWMQCIEQVISSTRGRGKVKKNKKIK